MVNKERTWFVYTKSKSLNNHKLKQLFTENKDIKVQLLLNRNITDLTKVHEYMNNKHNSPSSVGFNDMDVAVSTILSCIKNGDKIGIFGDFDADGITGTAIFVKIIKLLNGEPVVCIPNRLNEGHGLNRTGIKALINQGCKLIITVDTGSSDSAIIQEFINQDCKFIITDHHQTEKRQIDNVVAHINPQIETSLNQEYSGAGVAFKVAEAIFTKIGKPILPEISLLACIGTISDCVPLTKENREIVKMGLMSVQNVTSAGLNILIKYIFQIRKIKSITSQTVAYYIAPLINAPGRFGSAQISLELLTTNSKSHAQRVLSKIIELNNVRRKITKKALQKVADEVENQMDRQIILLDLSDYPVGIYGLIAGQIANNSGKVTAVYQSLNGNLRGSVRGNNITNVRSMLNSAKTHLEKFGGHQNAGGFTAKSVHKNKIFEAFDLHLNWTELQSKQQLIKLVKADIIAEFRQLTVDFNDFLITLEPTGESNHPPMFIFKQVEIMKISTIGRYSEHLKLVLDQHGVKVDAIAFNLSELDVGNNYTIDIMAEFDSLAWLNQRAVRVIVRALDVADRIKIQEV